jgi:hypothetical protein
MLLLGEACEPSKYNECPFGILRAVDRKVIALRLQSSETARCVKG